LYLEQLLYSKNYTKPWSSVYIFTKGCSKKEHHWGELTFFVISAEGAGANI